MADAFSIGAPMIVAAKRSGNGTGHQKSRFSTLSALAWMNSRRGSTTSPISLVKMSSASARSSIFTCRKRARLGVQRGFP
jgi:hypothetical protein